MRKGSGFFLRPKFAASQARRTDTTNRPRSDLSTMRHLAVRAIRGVGVSDPRTPTTQTYYLCFSKPIPIHQSSLLPTRRSTSFQVNLTSGQQISHENFLLHYCCWSHRCSRYRSPCCSCGHLHTAGESWRCSCHRCCDCPIPSGRTCENSLCTECALPWAKP